MDSTFPSRKLERLLSMDAKEVTVRLKQELSKKLDVIGLFRPPLNALPISFSNELGRFFFDAEELPHRMSLIRNNIPDFENNLLCQAEQILNHQFPLLGYGSLDYGKDIDWQLDIVSGKRAPLKPWPNIRYLDFQEVGDHKVIWELSRHQFLPTLAKAWLLTGEERFVKGLEDIFYDWQRKNPYPLGINWASSLELAFRSLSWIWVIQLLSGCRFAAKLREDMMLALAFHGWYIQRYLSTYFSPNTHLQGEAVALYFIGTACPSLPNAKKWRENGWHILLEHAFDKVLEDGAYFEQSTYYHVYALDFFLHARILAERNTNPFPSSYDNVLKKMLGQLSYLCQAGPPPRFGDDDGGRVFDGRRNHAMHLSDPLVIGTALYGQSDFKQPGLSVTEELLWLLGEDGLRAFSDCQERESACSTIFKHTGLYISHVGKGADSQVVIDAGPLGGGSGGHGHADALSITLNLEGKPVLVDPGTYKYLAADSERNDFRLTPAHNTITVDGTSQTNPKSAFSWHQWAKVTVKTEIVRHEFDFIRASHDGYTHLPSPVTHARILFNPHQGFWFVLDQLTGEGTHDYVLNWHLAPNSILARVGDTQWSVETDKSKLHILTTEGWHSTSSSGWFSPAYGIKQPAPVLSFNKYANGNQAIATVLWSETPNINAPYLTKLDHSAKLIAYCLTDNVRRSHFIFGNGIQSIEIEGWDSDAEFLYGSFNPDGDLTDVIALKSSFVHYKGLTVHESSAKEAHIVWRKPLTA